MLAPYFSRKHSTRNKFIWCGLSCSCYLALPNNKISFPIRTNIKFIIIVVLYLNRMGDRMLNILWYFNTISLKLVWNNNWPYKAVSPPCAFGSALHCTSCASDVLILFTQYNCNCFLSFAFDALLFTFGRLQTQEARRSPTKQWAKLKQSNAIGAHDLTYTLTSLSVLKLYWLTGKKRNISTGLCVKYSREQKILVTTTL